MTDKRTRGPGIVVHIDYACEAYNSPLGNKIKKVTS